MQESVGHWRTVLHAGGRSRLRSSLVLVLAVAP